MLAYTEKIQETARKLLKDKTVDVFIGYKKGTVPMMNEPVLIRDPDKADMLYWDSFCGLNLCNYLTKREDKIGVLATGCNSRNMVTHITENQIKREQLYIVGIPCTGMIDHRAVARAVGHREIVEVKESGYLLGSFSKDDGLFQQAQYKRNLRTPYLQEIKVTPSKGHFLSISGFGVRKTFYKNI